MNPIYVSLLIMMISFPLLAVSPEPKILGGQDATAAYPGVGALYERSNLQRPICGGSLVAPQWFMTAAHCVYVKHPVDIALYLDSQDLSRVSSADLTSIDRVFVHPQFDPDTLDNDIALLHLLAESDQSDLAGLMPPPQLEQLESGDMLRAVGWGDTLSEPNHPELLQEVDLPLRDERVCKVIYGVFTDNMLCVGEAGGPDSCFGDSGSPLYRRDPSGGWLQVGMVSFGTGNCGENPGGYTKVGNYLSWLVVGSDLLWLHPSLSFDSVGQRKRLTLTNASPAAIRIDYDPGQLQSGPFEIDEDVDDCQAITLDSGASCHIAIQLDDATPALTTRAFIVEVDDEAHGVELIVTSDVKASGSSGGSWSWAGVLGLSLLLWRRQLAALNGPVFLLLSGARTRLAGWFFCP